MEIKRGQKVLALCQKGNMRSVALAFLLKKEYKADALAAGLVTSSFDTINMLCQWADLVVVTDKKLFPLVPPGYKEKLLLWDVGTDRWFKGFSDDLLSKFRGYISNA